MSNNQILNPGRKFRPADTVLGKSDSEIDYPTLVAELKAIKKYFSGVKDSARIRMVYDNKPSSEKKRILTTRTGILIARPFRIIASRFEEASKQRAEAQEYVQKVVGGVYGEDSPELKKLLGIMTKNENNWINRDIDTEEFKKALDALKIPDPPQELNVKAENPGAVPANFSKQAPTASVALGAWTRMDTEPARTGRDIALGVGTNEVEGTPTHIQIAADAEPTGPGALPAQEKTGKDFDFDASARKDQKGRMHIPEGIKATYYRKPYMIDNADVFIGPKGVLLAENESRVLISGFVFSSQDKQALADGAGQGRLIAHEQSSSVSAGSATQTKRQFLVMAELALAQDNAQEKLKKAYTDAIETAYSNRADKSGNCAIVLIPYFSAMSANQRIENAQAIDAMAIAAATLEMRHKYNEKLQILVTTASVSHKDKITKALAEQANTPGAEAAPIQ